MILILVACQSSGGGATGGAVGTGSAETDPTVSSLTRASSNFIYRVNTNLHSISLGSIAGDGSIVEHETLSTGAGSSPADVIADLTKSYLFVARSGTATIATYSIDATTGSLTFESSIGTYGGPSKFALHPSGDFLYTLHSNNGQISVHEINADGSLTWRSAAAIGTPGAYAIAIDPTGVILAATSGSYRQTFLVNSSTGAITYSGNQTPQQDSALKFHPTGNLYAVMSMNNYIWAFDIDFGTGGFTGLSTTTGASLFVYRDIVFSADGTRAYLINGFTGRVEAYSVSGVNGALTFRNHVTLPSGCEPRSLQYFETQEMLYTACTNGSGKTIAYPVAVSGNIVDARRTSITGSANVGKILILE